MKITSLVLASAFLALPSLARANSDASDLAAGYAAAFPCMDKSTVTIAYSNAGQPESLKDVKEIKSFGGVLLLRFYNGEQQIIDAARIIKITEK